MNLVNDKYKCLVYTAGGATLAAAIALLTPWEPVKIVGLTVLTGVSYGIANDMFACRDCIEYFTVGHRYDGQKLRNRPLNTLDPTLNAIAWGSIATWPVCALAGVLFAFLARVPFPGLTKKITTAKLAPVLAVGILAILTIAHYRARTCKLDSTRFEYEGVPGNLQDGWHACNTRNLTGYLSLVAGGALLSIGIIASRAGLIKY